MKRVRIQPASEIERGPARAAALEALRNEIQIGLESGTGEELDMAEIKATARMNRRSDTRPTLSPHPEEPRSGVSKDDPAGSGNI